MVDKNPNIHLPQAPQGPVYTGGVWRGGFDPEEHFHH